MDTWTITDVSDQLLIYNTTSKTGGYYDKTGLKATAESGYLVIKDGATEVLRSAWKDSTSQVSSPSSTDLLDLLSTVNGYIKNSATGGETLYGNVKLITSLADFPDPISSVIQLADSTTYKISGAIDLGSNRIAMGTNTTISGNSPALDYLYSSTTGALITASTSFRMIQVGFQASSGSIFSLNGSGSEICYMLNVRFFGTGTLGSVANYDLFEVNSGLFIAFTGGLTFTGSNGSLIFIDTEFFQVTGTPTSVNLSTSTWNLIRFLGCSFTTVTGGTGLAVAASGANLNSGYIGQINACAFYGAGTHISGYSALDDEWAVGADVIGILPSDRIQPGGHGYYDDAATTPATQALTTTAQKLQIDGGGSRTEESYLPVSIRGISSAWNTTSDKINAISLGDTIDVRLDLNITATGGAAASLYVTFDVGGAATVTNTLVDRVVSYGKAAPFTLSFTTTLEVNAAFLANGCQIFLATDAGTSTLAARGILIKRATSGAI